MTFPCLECGAQTGLHELGCSQREAPAELVCEAPVDCPNIEKLVELRELLAKATPGPWYAADWNQDDGPNPSTIEARYQAEPSRPGYTCVWPEGIGRRRIAETEEGVNPINDAALIVAAVNALPDLLDEITSLHRRVGELEKGLEHYGQQFCEGYCQGGPVFDEKLFDCAGCRARALLSEDRK